MVDVLLESSNRAYRSPLAKAVPIFNRSADNNYFADIKDMMDLANESKLYYSLMGYIVWCSNLIIVVKKRRENPQANKDVLTMMIDGRDPQTGEGLSDQLIMYNVRCQLYS